MQQSNLQKANLTASIPPGYFLKKDQLVNHCPGSLVESLGKCIEEEALLRENQHGFCKESSCFKFCLEFTEGVKQMDKKTCQTNNVVNTQKHYQAMVDRGNLIDTVIDTKKALDKVLQQRTLSRLSIYEDN